MMNEREKRMQEDEAEDRNSRMTALLNEVVTACNEVKRYAASGEEQLKQASFKTLVDKTKEIASLQGGASVSEASGVIQDALAASKQQPCTPSLEAEIFGPKVVHWARLSCPSRHSSLRGNESKAIS